MEYISYQSFRQQLSKDVIFTANDVKMLFPDLSRRSLWEWQRKGYIKKLINEYYIFTEADINENHLMMIANQLYPHSYVSLESALRFYDLIPEAVYSITCCTTKRTRYYDTPIGYFSYRMLKPQYYFGYIVHQVEHIDYLIATPEKAILDFLYFRADLKDINSITALRINTSIYNDLIDRGKVNSYLDIMNNRSLYKRYLLLEEVIQHA